MNQISSPRSTPARDQVLSSALELFTGQGFFNTSIPDIVRVSGVSTGSIYHHFGDKEGIAKALYDTLIDRVDSALTEIEHRHNSAHDRCHAIVKLMFSIARDEPEIMKYMLHARHREFMPSVAPVCSSRPFQHMRDMVAQGINNGEMIALDNTVVAAAVFGGALRMIQLHLDGILERPLEEYMDDVWQCAWRSVAK